MIIVEKEINFFIAILQQMHNVHIVVRFYTKKVKYKTIVLLNRLPLKNTDIF